MPSNAPTVAPDSADRAAAHRSAAAGTGAGVRPAPAAPPLRQLPARRTEPPFDDELTTAAASSDAAANLVQGALALSFALPGGLPAVPDLPPLPRPGEQPRRLRLVPPIEVGSAVAPGIEGPSRRRVDRRRSARQVGRDDFGPQRTPRALLPQATPWAARLVQALVEVTSGLRPVSQLVRWTTTDVHDAVKRRVAHTQPRNQPGRGGVIVRSVHVSEPGDGVAEVCAVIQRGARCQALALRLEGVDGRWQCVALQGDGFRLPRLDSASELDGSRI